jgi:DNA-binding transcriptional regulator GbsR (MarR family)
MDDIRNKIIDDIGGGYAKFGHSQLLGRVVGLLICEADPVTVDQMCEVLDITKSPVNQICRRLEDIKLIRKVWVKGQRKYHYEIVPDVYLQAVVNQMSLYEDNLQMIDDNLKLLLKQYISENKYEKEKLRIVCERLIRMRELHVRFTKLLYDFTQEWMSSEENSFSVNDYIEEFGLSDEIKK